MRALSPDTLPRTPITTLASGCRRYEKHENHRPGIEKPRKPGSIRLAARTERTRVLADLQARIAAIETRPAALLDERPGDAPAENDADTGLTHKEQTINRKAGDSRLSLGSPEADALLGGGFPTTGLSELRLAETRDGGGLAGFALALALRLGATPARPLLWIGDGFAFSEAGTPYGPGFASFGFDPAALILVRTRKLADAIWAGEEAAASPAPAATILETRGNPARLGLEGTRRLHWRAREAGRPVLLLRQSARPETTAAPLRLAIRPRPASAVADLAGEKRLIGRPVFEVALEKTRDGRERRLLLEWDRHDRRFTPLAPLSGRDAAEAGNRPDPAHPAGAVVAFGRAS